MKKLYIETERLIIQNLKQEDLEPFHAYRSVAENCQFQGYAPMNLKEALIFIKGQEHKIFGQAGEWVQYAIISKRLGHLIGDCAVRLKKPDPRIAEIGISISHLHQKQGFAKEAMLGIMTFLFEKIQVHRIVETVDDRNTASYRLMKSLGFRQEGHFIENAIFKGKWGSVYQFAMLKREWEGLKPE